MGKEILCANAFLIPSCCKGAVLARCHERGRQGDAPRLMWRAAHRWRLIDAPFTLALAALLLPVAAPQAVEEGFPQQQPHLTTRWIARAHAHTHRRTRSTRTGVGESESDQRSRFTGGR